MKKILVPIDGSSSSVKGIEKAIDLARNTNSSITILHVITVPPVFVIGHSKEKVKKNLAKKAQKFIKDAEDRCINQNVKYVTKLIYGYDPPYDIEQFVKKNKHDMIVVGAKGKNSLKRVLLGSVSNYLAQTSKTPITIVR